MALLYPAVVPGHEDLMAKAKKGAAPVAEVAPEKAPLRLEWRSPGELAENPNNWRRHPEAQVEALADVIAEVGWAGACLFNERTGRLIDGHARKAVAAKRGMDKVPVLVGDWSEADEAKILATLDPLGAMAEADKGALDKLLRDVQTGSEDLAAVLTKLAADAGVVPGVGADESGQLRAQFQVLVECESESAQADLLARLTGEGYKCRSLIS